MKQLKYIIGFLVFFLSIYFTPLLAAPTNVIDQYGLLNAQETEGLNQQAANISKEYQCGVYIRVMPDLGGNSNVERYAEAIYYSEGMQDQYDGNMVMLLVVMGTRDYDISAHGDIANRAFTDYGKAQIANSIVYRLADGKYYEAFDTFLNQCDYMLEQESYDTPVDDPTIQQREQNKRSLFQGLIFGGSPLTALLICLGLKSRNRSKSIKSTAADYVPKKGFVLTNSKDLFIHRDVIRTPLPRNDSSSGGSHSGGTTVNSGGFSHHSGKF